MNLWEWFTATASVDSLLPALGLGALAILFARDMIMTKGQHLRRVQDLIDHHKREQTEKDFRAADLRESRDGWKEAARIERERADKATASVGDMADVMESILHVLQSLDRALPRPERGEHERAGQGPIGSVGIEAGTK